MPNNPLIVAAVQAICAGGAQAGAVEGGWRRDKTGAPLFEFWSGSGGRIFVSIEAPAHLAWTQVQSYSPLTLDCAVALLACLASDPFRAQTVAPRRGHIWLGAPAVLNAKAYKRFGCEREAFASLIDAEIAKLMNMRFAIVEYPGFDPAQRKWNSRGVSRSGVALFERAPEPAPADPGDCGRGAPLRFGAWCEHWLNAGGAMWVSSISDAVLQLDHRENRGPDAMAKKIAVLLALNWGAARKTDEICIEVRTLLRRIGELRRPGAEARTPTGRLADRLEEALLRLTESGLQRCEVQFDQAMELRAAHRRWRDDWLDSVIVFKRRPFLDGADETVRLHHR